MGVVPGSIIFAIVVAMLVTMLVLIVVAMVVATITPVVVHLIAVMVIVRIIPLVVLLIVLLVILRTSLVAIKVDLVVVVSHVGQLRYQGGSALGQSFQMSACESTLGRVREVGMVLSE